jgi:hypothetical protein
MAECLKQDNLVIYSTDNKSDQMDQCFSRVKTDIEILLDHMNVSVLAIPLMYENKFKQQLPANFTRNIPTIIVLMDNNSQVSKLKERLIILNEEVSIPQTTIFHDEGDVITKCMELHAPKKWIINDLNQDNINIWKLVKNDPEYIKKEFFKFKRHFF